MKINIIRDQDLLALGNKVKIYVNGKYNENILNQDKNVLISLLDNEKNIIYFKMGWCYSNKIEINKIVENKNIKVSYRITEKQKIVIVFGVILFMFLSIILNKFFFIGMLLFMIYPLYLTTFGRHKFLKAELSN